MKTRRWRSSTVEQLICNQQAAGSIPIASSVATEDSSEKLAKGSVPTHGRAHRRIGPFSEGFPSGQREQTVNLSPLASKVRILPPPPPNSQSVENRIAMGCGSSSVGRALAFQARRRGFEPRLPLSRHVVTPASGSRLPEERCRNTVPGDQTQHIQSPT